MGERSNIGKSVTELDALIADRVKRTQERHDAARARGDDDDCHVGLSAWAEGIGLDLLRTERELAEAGWTAEFNVLVDAATGADVPSKVIKTQYGVRRALVDAHGNLTGTFFSTGPAAAKKRGYKIEARRMPARAVIRSTGTGLSGCASARVIVVRDTWREGDEIEGAAARE